jgi:hypothetical protein
MLVLAPTTAPVLGSSILASLANFSYIVSDFDPVFVEHRAWISAPDCL